MPPADGSAAVTALAPAFPPPPAGRIVLSWLIRLRWFAVAGQLIAIGVAAALLGLDYPMIPLAAVLAVTLLSNAALALWLALSRLRRDTNQQTRPKASARGCLSRQTSRTRRFSLQVFAARLGVRLCSPVLHTTHIVRSFRSCVASHLYS